MLVGLPGSYDQLDEDLHDEPQTEVIGATVYKTVKCVRRHQDRPCREKFRRFWVRSGGSSSC